jgi:SAM-dependent methyltransferase
MMALLRIRGQGGLLWRMLPLVRLGFSALGRSWIDFYAWMLDWQERHNTIEGLLKRKYSAPGRDKGLYDFSRGSYHASYLVRHGLRPNHFFLDFGCGLGRTAVPVLRILDAGCYIGLDISRERIRLARDYIEREGLGDRGAELVVNRHNDFSSLVKRRVDFAWAQSVFTHMPASDVSKVIENMAKVQGPGGIFMFNFNVGPSVGSHINVKDYFYTLEFIGQVADRNGYDLQTLDDWKDDLPPESRDENSAMVKLVRRAT